MARKLKLKLFHLKELNLGWQHTSQRWTFASPCLSDVLFKLFLLGLVGTQCCGSRDVGIVYAQHKGSFSDEGKAKSPNTITTSVSVFSA